MTESACLLGSKAMKFKMTNFMSEWTILRLDSIIVCSLAKSTKILLGQRLRQIAQGAVGTILYNKKLQTP